MVSTVFTRLVTQKPMVTAGLKCPPEMCPRAETMIAIARPWASAMPRRPRPLAPCKYWSVQMEPAPKKISANVPRNSAISFCAVLYIRKPPYTERKVRPIRTAAFYLECDAERQPSSRTFHRAAGIRSIVLGQTHAAHQIGKPGIAAQRHESFMVEQHGHAAIASLKCHLERSKSMILFTQSCVDSSNVLPGGAIRLGLLDDITKNLSGLFDSAGLRACISEHASVDGRFRRRLDGLLKFFHGFLIFSIAHQRKSKKKVAEGKIALQVERFLELRDCFLRPAAPGKNLAMYRIDDEREGVRFLRAPDHSQRFVVARHILQEFRIPLQSGSVSLVDGQSAAKLTFGAGKIPIKDFEDLAHGDMGFGKGRIQIQSLRSRRPRLGSTFCL